MYTFIGIQKAIRVKFSQKGSKSVPKFTSETLKNKRLEDGYLVGSHF